MRAEDCFKALIDACTPIDGPNFYVLDLIAFECESSFFPETGAYILKKPKWKKIYAGKITIFQHDTIEDSYFVFINPVYEIPFELNFMKNQYTSLQAMKLPPVPISHKKNFIYYLNQNDLIVDDRYKVSDKFHLFGPMDMNELISQKRLKFTYLLNQ